MDSTEEWVVLSLEKDNPTLVLTLRDETHKLYSERSIAAWLKSSLFLWYSYLAYGDINFYKPSIYNRMKIPFNKIFQPSNELDNYFGKLIDVENKFLDRLNECNKSDNELEEMIVNHNWTVSQMAVNIDKIIFNAFNVTESERNAINNFFKNKKIYNVLEETNLSVGNQFEEEAAST